MAKFLHFLVLQILNLASNGLPILGGESRKRLYCLLFGVNSLFAAAQSFPVQIIPQLVTPPPIYFSHYANSGTINGPIRVQIILNDFRIADREIRLRTYFEGNGISFHSNDL